MRALCGAIITAGALIGLGLAGLGVGLRYQGLAPSGPDNAVVYIRWNQLDTPLQAVLFILIAASLIGLAIAFVGLAYHHERRHRERMRELSEPHVRT
ncbi:MAG TPA: hypothetical protein VGZ22_19690 [Isosphaeraceae bacterium]|jgi:hypothetical protein|nr:hypothetical protein [Isosphaeraceae bacterium]